MVPDFAVLKTNEQNLKQTININKKQYISEYKLPRHFLSKKLVIKNAHITSREVHLTIKFKKCLFSLKNTKNDSSVISQIS